MGALELSHILGTRLRADARLWLEVGGQGACLLHGNAPTQVNLAVAHHLGVDGGRCHGCIERDALHTGRVALV